MKKLLLCAALITANFVFAQLTLEHSFVNEETYVYSTTTETYYIAKTVDNKIKIYNSDYSVYKTITVPLPSGYNQIFFNANNNSFSISKNVFNTDNKIEVLIAAYSPTQSPTIKLLLINEDGTLLKDFNTNANSVSAEKFEVFHNAATNSNKIVVHNTAMVSGNYIEQTEVYALPTSTLTAKEILNKATLSAFPVPTSKILNVMNPGNGANKIEIFDASGKLVLNKSFVTAEDKISIDVEQLTKGTYFYKVGNLSSKFTKN